MTVYSRAQLAKSTGETTFVIGHHVRTGLIPPAVGSGAHRHYTEEHLHRILAIRKLRAEGLRGGDLATRLGEASDDEIRRLAGVFVPPPPPPPPVVPVRPEADVRRAIAAVVIATADALDLAPRRARVGLVAAIRKMEAEGLSVADVAGALLLPEA